MRKDEKIEIRCTQDMKVGLHRLRRLTGSRSLSDTIRQILEEAVTSGCASSLTAAIPVLHEIALHIDRLTVVLHRLLLTPSCPDRHDAIDRALAQIESLSHQTKALLPPRR